MSLKDTYLTISKLQTACFYHKNFRCFKLLNITTPRKRLCNVRTFFSKIRACNLICKLLNTIYEHEHYIDKQEWKRIFNIVSGVTVYLAPLDSLPPGGQAVPGYLAPHPGYLHPRGASCPGRFILPPANTSKNICMLFCYFSVSF